MRSNVVNNYCEKEHYTAYIIYLIDALAKADVCDADIDKLMKTRLQQIKPLRKVAQQSVNHSEMIKQIVRYATEACSTKLREEDLKDILTSIEAHFNPDAETDNIIQNISENAVSQQKVVIFHVAKHTDGSPEIVAPLLDVGNIHLLKGLLRTDSIAVHEVSHFEKDLYLFLFDNRTQKPHTDVMIIKFKRVGNQKQYINMDRNDLKAVVFALDNYL